MSPQKRSLTRIRRARERQGQTSNLRRHEARKEWPRWKSVNTGDSHTPSFDRTSLMERRAACLVDLCTAKTNPAAVATSLSHVSLATDALATWHDVPRRCLPSPLCRVRDSPMGLKPSKPELRAVRDSPFWRRVALDRSRAFLISPFPAFLRVFSLFRSPSSLLTLGYNRLVLPSLLFTPGNDLQRPPCGSLSSCSLSPPSRSRRPHRLVRSATRSTDSTWTMGSCA